jgi:hypothetical protein
LLCDYVKMKAAIVEKGAMSVTDEVVAASTSMV